MRSLYIDDAETLLNYHWKHEDAIKNPNNSR